MCSDWYETSADFLCNVRVNSKFFQLNLNYQYMGENLSKVSAQQSCKPKKHFFLFNKLNYTPFEMKFNTGLRGLGSYRNVNDSRLPSLLHDVSLPPPPVHKRSCFFLFSLKTLKVHKIENFFDSDFGICVISLLFMSKY
jgi:hypothetical protein